MRKFDYSFLAEGTLPSEIVNLAFSIAELKERAKERKSSNLKIFTQLEDIAKIQSVKGSNEIEGIVTTDKRINEIVKGNSAPLNHSEAEIAGYRDALSLIHSQYGNIQINEKTILNLHDILLQYTGSYEGGEYKTEDNVIMERDKDGNRRVRFVPMSAKETPMAMKQMLLAYIEARGDSRINKLLLIPCFILDFLSIHPFADGNGRMSRLLSLLLLYKNGFDVGKYVSFEEQINKSKFFYYEALRISSIGWSEGKNDYAPFIKDFISTLLTCYRELDKRFAVVSNKKVNKKNRVEAVVLGSILPLSKKEIVELLPDVSYSTVEKVLSFLIDEGKVKKVGTFKNAKYTVI